VSNLLGVLKNHFLSNSSSLKNHFRSNDSSGGASGCESSLSSVSLSNDSSGGPSGSESSLSSVSLSVLPFSSVSLCIVSSSNRRLLSYIKRLYSSINISTALSASTFSHLSCLRMVVLVRMDQTKYSSGRRFNFFIVGGTGNVEYLIMVSTPLNSHNLGFLFISETHRLYAINE
jgi:hypothetical protein